MRIGRGWLHCNFLITESIVLAVLVDRRLSRWNRQSYWTYSDIIMSWIYDRLRDRTANWTLGSRKRMNQRMCCRKWFVKNFCYPSTSSETFEFAMLYCKAACVSIKIRLQSASFGCYAMCCMHQMTSDVKIQIFGRNWTRESFNIFAVCVIFFSGSEFVFYFKKRRIPKSLITNLGDI